MKRRMKRLTALLMIMMLVCSGCAGTEEPVIEEEAEIIVEEVEEEPEKVVEETVPLNVHTATMGRGDQLTGCAYKAATGQAVMEPDPTVQPRQRKSAFHLHRRTGRHLQSHRFRTADLCLHRQHRRKAQEQRKPRQRYHRHQDQPGKPLPVKSVKYQAP